MKRVTFFFVGLALAALAGCSNSSGYSPSYPSRYDALDRRVSNLEDEVQAERRLRGLRESQRMNEQLRSDWSNYWQDVHRQLSR